MKSVDGRGLCRFINHFHKSKAALATGVALQREGTVRDLSVSGEQFDDVLLLGAEGQIADKNAHLTAGPNEKGTQGIRQAIGSRSGEGALVLWPFQRSPVITK